MKKSNLVVFVAGVLFAVGLALSGMTDPGKVIGFLDVTGAWDPSLALVMVGAIGVHATLRLVILKRAQPVFQPAFEQPLVGKADVPLLVGAAVFGLGWGLGGYCPGPAFVSAAAGSLPAAVFVGAMTGGMLLHRVLHVRAADDGSLPVSVGCDAVAPASAR